MKTGTLPWLRDRFGRAWQLPKTELCPTCGQPDNTGECNHLPLTDEEVEILGGRS